MVNIRQQIQDELVEFIEARNYTAPYGVLAGLETSRLYGNAHTISFGVARYLDAEIIIWSPAHISVRTQGALSRFFQRTYTSVEDLKKDLAQTATLKTESVWKEFNKPIDI